MYWTRFLAQEKWGIYGDICPFPTFALSWSCYGRIRHGQNKMADMSPWKMQPDAVRKRNVPTSLRVAWVSSLIKVTGLDSKRSNPQGSFLPTPSDQTRSPALGQRHAFHFRSWTNLINWPLWRVKFGNKKTCLKYIFLKKWKPLKRTRQFPTMTWIVESKVIIFCTKWGDNTVEYSTVQNAWHTLRLWA